MDALALPNDPAALKSVIAELEERVRLLLAMIYGSKSEKRQAPDASQQYSLFDEAEVAPELTPEAAAIVQIPAHDRKKRGRRPLPRPLSRKAQPPLGRVDSTRSVTVSPGEQARVPCGCRVLGLDSHTFMAYSE